MKTISIPRSLRGACAFILLAGVAAFGDYTPSANNPDTNAADRNLDKDQPNSVPGAMEKSKDAADRGMNKVDNGVHSLSHKTKKTAKKAKHNANKGMDKMEDKSKNAADEMSQPAEKPAS
jgi:hypothetical protein